jgi:hypothetical protein
MGTIGDTDKKISVKIKYTLNNVRVISRYKDNVMLTSAIIGERIHPFIDTPWVLQC